MRVVPGTAILSCSPRVCLGFTRLSNVSITPLNQERISTNCNRALRDRWNTIVLNGVVLTNAVPVNPRPVRSQPIRDMNLQGITLCIVNNKSWCIVFKTGHTQLASIVGPGDEPFTPRTTRSKPSGEAKVLVISSQYWNYQRGVE